MFRVSTTLASLLFILCETLCLAQDPTGTTPATTQPAVGKRNTRSFRAEDPHFLVDQMSKDLNLDEAQQQAIAKAFKDHQAYMVSIRQSMQSQPTEGYDKMRAISEEVRIAREANDTEKVKQLTDQLRQLSQEQQARLAPMREKLAANQEKLRSDILALLRADQQTSFEKFWDERMARRSPYRGPERSPQTLKTLVDRLPALSAEQKQQIEDLFRHHKESEKTTPKGSPAERLLVTKLYDSVMTLLTPDQRSLLESQLAGRRSSARGAEGVPPTPEANPPPAPKTPQQPETPQAEP